MPVSSRRAAGASEFALRRLRAAFVHELLDCGGGAGLRFVGLVRRQLAFGDGVVDGGVGVPTSASMTAWVWSPAISAMVWPPAASCSRMLATSVPSTSATVSRSASRS